MRNLVEFPVTKQEVIECLEQFYNQLESKELQVGDMRQMFLLIAIEAVDWWLDEVVPIHELPIHDNSI